MHRFHNHSMEEQLLRLLTLYPGRHTQSELAHLLQVTSKRFEKIWSRLLTRYQTLHGVSLTDYLQDVSEDGRKRKYRIIRTPISFLGTLNGYDKTIKRQGGIPYEAERMLSLWYALQDLSRPVHLEEWLNAYSELDERGLSRKEATPLIQQLISLQVVSQTDNGLYQTIPHPFEQLSLANHIVYYVTSLHASTTTYSPIPQFMSEYFSTQAISFVSLHGVQELPLLTASKRSILQKLVLQEKKCALFTYRQAEVALTCHILDLVEEPLTKRVYAVTDHPGARKIRIDRIRHIDILSNDFTYPSPSQNTTFIHLRFFSTDTKNPWILNRVRHDIQPHLLNMHCSSDVTEVWIETDEPRQYFPWVRAFGSSCEWVAPQTERTLFYQHLLEMRERYESAPS